MGKNNKHTHIYLRKLIEADKRIPPMDSNAEKLKHRILTVVQNKTVPAVDTSYRHSHSVFYAAAACVAMLLIAVVSNIFLHEKKPQSKLRDTAMYRNERLHDNCNGRAPGLKMPTDIEEISKMRNQMKKSDKYLLITD